MLVFNETKQDDWFRKAIAQSIANGSIEIKWNPDRGKVDKELRKELDTFLKKPGKKKCG